MPKGADVILSVGPNGRWYFDWFDEEYGPVKRHIGVEAYTPQPEKLPNNVDWIAEDLAAPGGVAAVETGSVDLVFSGQNIEHLWPEQVVSLLSESNRVLRKDGLLVVDSPNRLLTSVYQWSMGEHTVEFDPVEAETILRLGGFALERMKGLWLCNDNGRLLPLEPSDDVLGGASWVRRIVRATERPHDSFIWWAEARKIGEPDVLGLLRAVTSVFEASWPERVARVKPLNGITIDLPDGRPGVYMPRGSEGYALIGPYMALPPGTFTFSLPVEWDGGAGETVCRLELIGGDELLGSAELEATNARGNVELSCTTTIHKIRFAVHVRLWCPGVADVTAPLTLTMSPDPWH